MVPWSLSRECRQPDIADRTRVEHVGETPELLSRQRRVDSVGQHAGRSAARGFQSCTGCRSMGGHTSTRTISADGEGRRRYLIAALLFCTRLVESLSFAASRPGFFRHSGEVHPLPKGDSLVQHVQESAGFRRDQPCDPFPGSTPPYAKQTPFPPLLHR